MHKVLLDISSGEMVFLISFAVFFLLLIVFGPISAIIQIVKQHKNIKQK